MPPYSESYSLGRKRVRTPPQPKHNLTFPVLIFHRTGAARKRAERNGRDMVAGCVGMKWRLRQDESRGRKTREEARAIVRSSYQARSEVI